MLNNQGRVAGFARGNIFALLDGKLVTPPLAEGVLDGIVRHHLLQQAGLDTVESVIEKGSLAEAGGLFITNSLLGCVPVTRLDGADIPLDADLADRLREVI
jgi:branched-chain amino acid aminotransferase